MLPILHSFDMPKCETCAHWTRIRPHAGRCKRLTDGLVYVEPTTTSAGELLEQIEDSIEQVTLDFFGCRFHTDIIPEGE